MLVIVTYGSINPLYLVVYVLFIYSPESTLSTFYIGILSTKKKKDKIKNTQKQKLDRMV